MRIALLFPVSHSLFVGVLVGGDVCVVVMVCVCVRMWLSLCPCLSVFACLCFCLLCFALGVLGCVPVPFAFRVAAPGTCVSVGVRLVVCVRIIACLPVCMVESLRICVYVCMHLRMPVYGCICVRICCVCICLLVHMCVYGEVACPLPCLGSDRYLSHRYLSLSRYLVTSSLPQPCPATTPSSTSTRISRMACTLGGWAGTIPIVDNGSSA